MKLQTITIADVDMTYDDATETYHRTESNHKKVPAYLSNAAVKYGYDNGLLKSSLYSDLLAIYSDYDLSQMANMSEDERQKTALGVFSDINLGHVLTVIYLAYRGANYKGDLMDFDGFCDRYADDDMTKITVYMGLIQELLQKADKSKFVKTLKANTKTDSKKKHQR